MTEPSSNACDRRELFRQGLRWLALATLAGTGGALLRRRQLAVDPEQHACNRLGLCSGCPRLPACVLPQALSRRQASAGAESGRQP